MITLLDYGAGNVRSVINAIESLGEQVHPCSKRNRISFPPKSWSFPASALSGNMMEILNRKNFVAPLLDYLKADRPFLGICLGLQALFESSEEAPEIPGLGFIRGTVQRFSTELSVPHIGWNGLNVHKPSKLFAGLLGNEKFYFVHSYHVKPHGDDTVLTTTDYGYGFVSAIQKGNVMATQFHPEKSGKHGLRLLENFLGNDETKVLPAKISTHTLLAKRIIACLDVRTNDSGDLVVTKERPV